METMLLATKVRIPPSSQHTLHRARLVEALERGIPHHKLALLAAPAGYGKTTLLAQWAHARRLPIAWLSLSAEDNDLERFLRYLLAAWDEVQPGVIERPVGLLLGGMMPDTEAVLSAFLNLATDLPGHLVFVLDDYQLIEEPAIHQALAFLLDHLPSMLHFVLAGRSEPPLPLARYRARQQLLEFHAEDLQFVREETAEFLNRLMKLDLSDDELATLHAQLEGWIVGLQVVSLTLRRNREALVTLGVSGRHRFIADYLSEEVLAQLPEDTQQFLLQTSLLDQLCGSLCAAVTEGRGGQAVLERLERENLFLVPLDDRREWYRYHRLFADFLQHELERQRPDEVAQLHRRAGRWYLAHDLPEQALRHAVAGADAALAAHVFDNYVHIKLNTGELRVVKRWLEALPVPWRSAHAVFGIAQAGLLAFTGAMDACLRCIAEVEQRLEPVATEQARRQLAKVTAVRCAIACMQDDVAQAEAYAGQALHNLSVEDDPFLHLVYGALGDAYRRHGRWHEARQCYLTVLGLPHGPAYRWQSVHAFGALADLELRQGRLREAAAYWRRALEGLQDRAAWGSYPLPVIGWVYIRMGEILYEWNELAEAADHLSQGLERAELGGDVRALIAGCLLAGRLKLAMGDIAAAGAYLERVRPLLERAPLPDWIGRFERLQLEYWLAQDRLRAAVHWSDELLTSDARERRPDSAEARLATARVLIVKGNAPSLDRGLALLGGLREATEAEGRAGVQIEALALQALALWRRGDPAGALSALERALRLAEPEGYVRLFADLGPPMARLLHEARSRAVLPEYVDKLLAALGGDLPSSGSMVEALPEPLTPREMDVLQLLAAGLTNREIGEQLVVSPETVKKHTGSIYDKLAVHSRREAVVRARELALLG